MRPGGWCQRGAGVLARVQQVATSLSDPRSVSRQCTVYGRGKVTTLLPSRDTSVTAIYALIITRSGPRDKRNAR